MELVDDNVADDVAVGNFAVVAEVVVVEVVDDVEVVAVVNVAVGDVDNAAK
jgi:hypothetical protein